MVTIKSRHAGLFKAFLPRRRSSHAYTAVIFESGGGARAEHGKINGPLRVKKRNAADRSGGDYFGRKKNHSRKRSAVNDDVETYLKSARLLYFHT